VPKRTGGGFFWRVLLSDGRKGATFSATLGGQVEQLEASRQELAGATFRVDGDYTYLERVEVK
jgi:hypothetical protein